MYCSTKEVSGIFPRNRNRKKNKITDIEPLNKPFYNKPNNIFLRLKLNKK